MHEGVSISVFIAASAVHMHACQYLKPSVGGPCVACMLWLLDGEARSKEESGTEIYYAYNYSP